MSPPDDSDTAEIYVEVREKSIVRPTVDCRRVRAEDACFGKTSRVLHDFCHRARRKWWMDSFDGAPGVMLDLVNKLLFLKLKRKIPLDCMMDFMSRQNKSNVVFGIGEEEISCS
jgi:hypothetical protein